MDISYHIPHSPLAPRISKLPIPFIVKNQLPNPPIRIIAVLPFP